MALSRTHIQKFLKYVLPSMVAMVANCVYVLIDTLFVTYINESALAALNIVLPVYSIIVAFGSFMAVGGSTHYSILKAQGKTHEASVFFTHAFVVGITVCLGISICVMFGRYPLAGFLGANEETLDMCIAYIEGYAPLAVFNVLEHLMVSFIRNDGTPRLASSIGFVSAMFKVATDYFFIYTLGLGMFGAGLDTGLASIVGCLVAVPYLLKRKNNFHLLRCRLSAKVLLGIGKLGLPTLISGASSGIVMLAFNKQLLAIGGTMAVTAYGIVFNVSFVVTYLLLGVSEGSQPLISSSYGKGQLADIWTFARLAIATDVIVSTIGMLFVTFGGDAAIGVFDPTNNVQLRALTKTGMWFYFAGLYFYGVSSFFSVYFTSVETPAPSTVISILKSGVVITPLVLTLPVVVPGLNGVWLSYPLSECIIMLVGATFFARSPYIKQKEKLEQAGVPA